MSQNGYGHYYYYYYYYYLLPTTYYYYYYYDYDYYYYYYYLLPTTTTTTTTTTTSFLFFCGRSRFQTIPRRQKPHQVRRCTTLVLLLQVLGELLLVLRCGADDLVRLPVAELLGYYYYYYYYYYFFISVELEHPVSFPASRGEALRGYTPLLAEAPPPPPKHVGVNALLHFATFSKPNVKYHTTKTQVYEVYYIFTK